MKEISANQPSLTKQHPNKKRWLIGVGVALAIGTIGGLVAVRQKPELLVPAIKAGVPLKWAASYSSAVDTAMTLAETPTISAQDLKQLIDSKDKNYLLLDVRTPEEYKISHIPGAVLVPLTEIQEGSGTQKVKSMLKGRRLIAYCTHGYRSGRALVTLKKAGVEGTQYAGGILEWTKEIDPSLPRNW